MIINVDAATAAWMAKMPVEAVARSNAYFEGGYWLQLWDFLCAAVISLALLQFGWSARMRDLAEKLTRSRLLQTAFYWACFLLLTTVLGFPLTVYEGYFREHQYGHATQTFGPWMGDQIKGLLVNLVIGGLLTIVLFGVVRRVRVWWIWGAAVTELFVIVMMLLAPVYLMPVFNKITPLEDPKVIGPILRMARANGIPAREIYQMDESKQTTRMSANVSGIGSTMRITVSDNLLRSGSPEEIQAVVGHEMGHYVLNHPWKGIEFFLIVIVAGFAFLNWSLTCSLARWGAKWNIRGAGDTAVLPLAMLLVSVYMFVLTPVQNTFVRTVEQEADMYGLNVSRQPDGFAQAAI